MKAPATSYYNWNPAGASACFSFLPLCTLTIQADPSLNKARILTEEGEHYCDATGLQNGHLPITQKFESTYFTHIFQIPGVYYEYFTDPSGPMGDRLNRIYDRNGNELNYHWYTDPLSGIALLSKITGEIVGNVIPYFEYPGNVFQPITKIYLYDSAEPQNSRSIYFEYNYHPYLRAGSLTGYGPFLKKIVSPNGCQQLYDMRFPFDTITENYYVPKREVDPAGFESYFEYTGNNFNVWLAKTVQPEGRITYYQYPLFNEDRKAFLGRRRSYFKIAYGDNNALPCMRQMTDSLGNTTYYNYLGEDVVDCTRYRSKQAANGAVTYFSYMFEDTTESVYKHYFGPRTVTSVYNGAQTYYEYAPENYDVVKYTGPRRVAATFEAVTYYTYDGRRNRTATIDALGNSTQYSRDSVGRVVAVKDARSNSTYFNYSVSTGGLDSQVDATGGVTYYGYDSYLNLTRSIGSRWPEQGFIAYTSYYAFDALNRMTVAIDRQRNVSYFDWDSRGALIKSTTPQGTSSVHTYDGLNRRTQTVVTDAGGSQLTQLKNGYDIYSNRVRLQNSLGNATYFFFDVVDRLFARKDAVLASTYFYYDPVSNLAATRNARGNFTYFGYDPLSRLVARRDAQSNATYYSYDLGNNKTHERDARLNTTYYFYDILDRQQSRRDALGNPTYFFFDAVSNITEVRNARGATTYFAFDELSRTKALRDAVGNKTYFFYDRAGNRTCLVDPRLGAAYFFYDTMDRLSAARDAVGLSTYYFYDSVGNRTQVRDAVGNPTYFFFDGLNRNKAMRDAVGSLSYFFYDTESNLICSRNPLLHPTYFGYDAIQRRTIVQDALGGVTYFQFDSMSNLVKLMDANKNAVQTRFDSLDRPDAIRMPDGGSSYFFYDGVSNKIKEVNPRGNATYYLYDALNRLSAIQDALGRNLYYEYDAVSNLSRFMDAEGATCDHTYDAVNRRTNLNYTVAGADVAASLKSSPYFVFDEASNLVQMGDLWGLHRWGYDALNRAVRHQFPNQNVVYFEYDAVSNLTGRVYPGAAGRAWAGYDTLNRPIRVQAPSGATAYFAYDVASKLTQRFLGNGAKQDVTYDAAERISQWRNTNKSGASLSYFDYTRDTKGRITKAVREATHTVYYTYDVNDRLMSEIWAKTGATPSEVYGYRYAYDVAGNRTKARVNGSNTYYSYDKANQLNVSGTTSAYATPTYYIYDKNGSLTNLVEPAGNTYFAYNAAGLVARIRWKDASATYFFYDGQLQRYGMVEFGTATYFLWDGPNLLQEVKADGTVKEEYSNARTPIAGIGQLLEINRPGQSPQKVYPIMDPRGTVTKQIQSDGTTVQAAKEYDAFGNIIPNSPTGTWVGRFTYQGQAWLEIGPADGSKRLLASPTRLYDPGVGRFIQNELLLDRRTFGHYLYSRQNPETLVDSSGLCDFQWDESGGDDPLNLLDEPKVPKIFDPDYSTTQGEPGFTYGADPSASKPWPLIGEGDKTPYPSTSVSDQEKYASAAGAVGGVQGYVEQMDALGQEPTLKGAGQAAAIGLLGKAPQNLPPIVPLIGGDSGMYGIYVRDPAKVVDYVTALPGQVQNVAEIGATVSTWAGEQIIAGATVVGGIIYDGAYLVGNTLYQGASAIPPAIVTGATSIYNNMTQMSDEDGIGIGLKF